MRYDLCLILVKLGNHIPGATSPILQLTFRYPSLIPFLNLLKSPVPFVYSKCDAWNQELEVSSRSCSESVVNQVDPETRWPGAFFKVRRRSVSSSSKNLELKRGNVVGSHRIVLYQTIGL